MRGSLRCATPSTDKKPKQADKEMKKRVAECNVNFHEFTIAWSIKQ